MTEQEAFQWWKTEQDEAGYQQSEIAALAWAAACKWEREACARLAMTEAVLQRELDTVRNPRAAVMHSPDSAKWQKMAALIRMRSALFHQERTW